MDNPSLKSYRFGNATDIGKIRKQNEDYMGYFVNQNGDFFVVCDGMGGHAGGAIASQTAVNAIRSFFEEKYHPNPQEALYQAIQFANDHIFEKARQNPDLQGMGTTCVVLMLRNARLYHAHVGDSRLYTHKFGQLSRITKDHSLVQNLVDQGLINESEAEHHPQRNQLLRALGTQPFVDVEVSEEALVPFKNDIYLLCTDGLNGLVSHEGIEQILNQMDDVQKIALRLVEMANALGGHDNITVQVIQFTQDANQMPKNQIPESAEPPLSNTKPIINYTPPTPKPQNPKNSGGNIGFESKPNYLAKEESPYEEGQNNSNSFASVENRGIDIEAIQPYLWRGLIALGVFFVLVLIYQRTLGKYELLGSTGSLQQDSIRAIQLEREFWNYFFDRNPEIKKAADTYKETKRKLKDLRERIAQLDTAFEQLRVVENPLRKSKMRLTELARRYNSDVEWILQANGGKKEQDIQDLDSLIIPTMPHKKSK